MIALFSFVPKHCPNCGEAFTFRDHLARGDYLASASHTCRGCGLHYQYVDGRKLLDLAGSVGDMTRYVTNPD